MKHETTRRNMERSCMTFLFFVLVSTAWHSVMAGNANEDVLPSQSLCSDSLVQQQREKLKQVLSFDRAAEMRDLSLDVRWNERDSAAQIPPDVDLGNGIFDKPALQMTGNCWAHAAINALNATVQGRLLLYNHFYKNPDNGVFVVHLQEAEDLGYHGGMYVIKPREIAEGASQLSSGDGDVTAFMIAVERYLREVEPHRNKKYASDKGYLYRMFEILTGLKHRQERGAVLRIIYYPSTNNARELMEAYRSGKCSAVFAIKGHAYSVVGIGEDNSFLVEDSQLDTKSKEFEIYHQEGCVTTYKIWEEVSYTYGFAILYFEE